MIPDEGMKPGTHSGLGCEMDCGGWFVIDELMDKINRYVFGSRTRPALTLKELATLASDGAEQLTKLRWQFSMIVRKKSCRRTGSV